MARAIHVATEGVRRDNSDPRFISTSLHCAGLCHHFLSVRPVSVSASTTTDARKHPGVAPGTHHKKRHPVLLLRLRSDSRLSSDPSSIPESAPSAGRDTHTGSFLMAATAALAPRWDAVGSLVFTPRAVFLVRAMRYLPRASAIH